MAKAAHELKNPAISISEVAQESIELVKESNSKLLKQNLVLIVNLCYYIISLVYDFDSLSKKENDIAINIIEDDFSIDEEIDFIQSFSNILTRKYKKEKLITFQVDNRISDQKVIMTSDKMRFRQVLINLISNSIKFTSSGSISLKIETINKYLYISVIDTGIGIGGDQVGKLFVKSFKSNVSSNLYGSGYGLMIIKDMIDLLKFRIDYSPNIPTGCIFKIEISNTKFKLISKSKISKSYKDTSVIESDTTKKVSFKEFSLSLGNSFKKIDHNENNNNLICKVDPSALKNHSYHYNYFDNTEEVVRLVIIIVDDEELLRKSSIRVIDNFFKSIRNKAIELLIYEAEDGIECLYTIYYLNNNNLKIDFILMDETMRYMSGCEASCIIDKYISMNIISSTDLYILSAYDISFLTEKYSTNRRVKKVLNKPLSNDIVKHLFEKIKLN